jgi:hypothetical protein
MAGFSDYDSIINALTVSLYGQPLNYSKPAAFTTVAASQWTLFNTSGLPAQGVYTGTVEAAQA